MGGVEGSEYRGGVGYLLSIRIYHAQAVVQVLAERPGIFPSLLPPCEFAHGVIMLSRVAAGLVILDPRVSLLLSLVPR